jgi:NAD(P)-dependent dehydrogenase (short-subunit alcohol dehydrogenase family)
LGEACARNLITNGAKVSILDVAEENGKKLASELGNSAQFVMTDITQEDQVQSALDETKKAFGSIHLAINCAGIGTPAKVLGKEGPIGMDLFNRVVEINLMGTMNVIRLSAAHMVKNPPNDDGEKGVVINTASIAAYDGQIGQAAYGASKAGVVGLTLPVAREFASYGIRVMTIAPGLFDTPLLAALPEQVKETLGKMIPFPSRLGKPDEFASLVQHIIANPMLNGEVIRLDGAIRMPPK